MGHYEADHRSEYYLHFSLLNNPIPTLRLHGIKCEQESAGCDEELVDAVAGMTETIMSETAHYLEKSKSLRVKSVGVALDVASHFVQGIAEFYKAFAGLIEGDDDVFMVRRMQDGSIDIHNAFFPRGDGEVMKMEEGKIVN